MWAGGRGRQVPGKNCRHPERMTDEYPCYVRDTEKVTVYDPNRVSQGFLGRKGRDWAGGKGLESWLPKSWFCSSSTCAFPSTNVY